MRGSTTIARRGGSPRVVGGGTVRQGHPGGATTHRKFLPPNAVGGGQSGSRDVGAERTRDGRGGMEGRCGGPPGRCAALPRRPDKSFRLRCRSIRGPWSIASGTVRSVKGAASFSSAPKRKQRRSILSRSREIERRRRMPQRQTVAKSFTVLFAPAPRQGRAGVRHSSFPSAFQTVFQITNPVRGSVDARALTCVSGPSRRAHVDVRSRHAKRLQGPDNAISMLLALARPCSRARAVDVVSVRARMRSSTLIRR